MPSNDYVVSVEKENEMLRKKLLHYDTLRDIISTRVVINNAAIGEMIDPMRLCEFMEKMGWTLNYEKIHERYLTRSYFSPHKDTKCKVYIRDLRPDSHNYGANIFRTKITDAIQLLARLHKKGELEVVYEILTGDIKETMYDANAK